ncbi:hypothetical protein CDAR_495501 [Caerostris darwini]|uniref:Uncharacterized protein n=1 Tax=Caerostris darwini TaxID=1538125 RepID=A0AAV4S8M8_9ARAC|nr:hypothetical protein CDAR_495501 [Caerostris darwini]
MPTALTNPVIPISGASTWVLPKRKPPRVSTSGRHRGKVDLYQQLRAFFREVNFNPVTRVLSLRPTPCPFSIPPTCVLPSEPLLIAQSRFLLSSFSKR